MGTSKFFLNNKSILDGSKIELPENAETFFFEPGKTMIFTDEYLKIKWLNESGFSIYYQKGIAKLKLLQIGNKDFTEIQIKVLHDQELADRKEIELQLIKEKIKPDNSKRLIDFIKSYNPNNIKNLSTFLYEHDNFVGSWRYSRHGIQIPNYKWINFNDIVSSAYVFGETICLCQHSWFGGMRKWIGGHPYWQQKSMGNFDNRTSSSFSF